MLVSLASAVVLHGVLLLVVVLAATLSGDLNCLRSFVARLEAVIVTCVDKDRLILNDRGVDLSNILDYRASSNVVVSDNV